ncbi:MAG: HD domain-containing protein [Clostridiales bacterium]|nr:HD domain-containing protein [Clostridiales bacterium]
MDKNIVCDAIEYVKTVFKDDYSGHDYFHTLRVYKLATRIAEHENADLLTVQLAALLHDVDDVKLSPETHANKDRAVAFLREHGVSVDMIKTVCEVIDEVSFRGADSVSPKTIEGKCVQDADRLDAIGAIGIARTFAFGGSHKQAIYDPDVKPLLNMSESQYRNHVSTTLNHFYEKLFLLKDMMNTSTAKKLAEERDEYMRGFVAEFLDEWDGNR